ncbi:translation initiation factor IF-3, partial [Pseudomonas sp. NPDC087615]|uniref:translation initiation factor IF-3 n=1 Tax=Pseudomonas sp. NPDC087615 TaxID=3364443 RepID=UPI0037FAF98A
MRQDKRAAPKAPINENISAREVRLIGAEGEQLGIVSIEDALLKAEEAKLDLVEISADAAPPVCKLMDYGKSIFEKKKQVGGGGTYKKQLFFFFIGVLRVFFGGGAGLVVFCFFCG